MGIKTLWIAFGASWLAMVSYAIAHVAWTNAELNALRAQMASIDKTQSIQMARVETELKQISATLIEIKQRMNEK